MQFILLSVLKLFKKVHGAEPLKAFYVENIDLFFIFILEIKEI